jgi:hypothetical protein
MSARLDYQVGGEAGYTGGDAWGVLPGDARDYQAMQPFAPTMANGQQMPWWESAMQYGIVRAIDNRFGAPNVSGNVNAGSFAGQNGATYGNRPNNAGGGARPQQADPGMGGLLMAGLLGLGAFLLLS